MDKSEQIDAYSFEYRHGSSIRVDIWGFQGDANTWT